MGLGLFVNTAKAILRTGLVIGLAFLLVIVVLSIHAAGHQPRTGSMQAGSTADFPEVPASDLAGQGITLADPGALTFAPIDQLAAVQTASRYFPASSVLHSAVVHFHFSRSQPPLDCVCWALSVYPPGGMVLSQGGPIITSSGLAPRPSPLQPVKYVMVFVDASNGKFVFATARGMSTLPSSVPDLPAPSTSP